MNAARRVLFIDPEETALNWLRCREAQNNMKLLTFHQMNFMTEMEEALTMGMPVIVHDVGSYIDPRINDLFTFQSKCKLINVADIAKCCRYEFSKSLIK